VSPELVMGQPFSEDSAFALSRGTHVPAVEDSVVRGRQDMGTGIMGPCKNTGIFETAL
jgi:hypothetical protein